MGIHEDTLVVLYFGGLKSLKMLNKGDILLGDDGGPRIVHAVTKLDTGLVPINCTRFMPDGDSPIVVNDSQFMVFMNKENERVLDLPAADYIKKEDSLSYKYGFCQQSLHCWKDTQVKNDPFLIGIVIGQTRQKSTEDILKDYLLQKLDTIGKFVSGQDSQLTKFNTQDTDEITTIANYKYIPECYLYGSHEVRMLLLKGIMSVSNEKNDRNGRSRSLTRGGSMRLTKKRSASAGSASIHGGNNSARRTRSRIPVLKREEKKIFIKDQLLAEQIKFLAKSLGYTCLWADKEFNLLGHSKQKTFIPFKTDTVVCDASQLIKLELDGNGRFYTGSCIILSSKISA